MSFRSGLHTFHNDKESPATPVNPERYEIKECSQRLNLGVQLCGTISLPKPAFSIQHPVTNLRGPIEYQLTLKKVEENLQGYHFIAQWNREKVLI